MVKILRVIIDCRFMIRMMPQNIDTIENTVHQSGKRQMMESEEQVNGSRSLDNITAGYTTNKTNFDEQQAFLSLNDSTSATKVEL